MASRQKTNAPEPQSCSLPMSCLPLLNARSVGLVAQHFPPLIKHTCSNRRELPIAGIISKLSADDFNVYP